MRVLTIDPGVTTGYTKCFIEPKKSLKFYPFQATDDVNDFWDRLEAFEPRYIVIEKFEYRNRARAGLNLFPVELIGVTHLYVSKARHQVALFEQTAYEGKGYYTDNILKQHGLYKRGIPHGMDATRHLLQWATFKYGYQYHSGQAGYVSMLDKWED
jgi:hypothetical protein